MVGDVHGDPEPVVLVSEVVVAVRPPDVAEEAVARPVGEWMR